jgi:hypothetical protein
LAHVNGQTETSAPAANVDDDCRSPEVASHPFYWRLNQLLREHEFDAFAGAQCATFYAETMGRPGLPPGIYLSAVVDWLF